MTEDLQESNSIKLRDGFNSSRTESEDSPGGFQERDVKRGIDTSKNQIAWNLTKDIGGTPKSVGVIKFITKHLEIFFHPTV